MTAVTAMGLIMFAMTGCKMVTSSSEAGKAAPAASTEQKPAVKKDRKSIKIGYSQFTLGAPYFVALVDSAKKDGGRNGRPVRVHRRAG